VVLDGSTEDLAERLAEELLAPGDRPEATVALRGRFRWVRRFRPVRLPQSEARLRQGGVYLLSGPPGETVLALAEHLFRAAGARLVLLQPLSPAAAPPRAKWAEWLAANDESDSTSRALRRLLTLEAEGCELMLLTFDLAQPMRMEEAVGRIRERFGALHGVIHAATITGAGLVQWKTRALAEAVLAPAVRWTVNLAEATADLKPDFLALFGSSATANGGFGQVDTCAAASFLDAFAQARSAAGAPFTQSLGWGNFRWQEVTAADPVLAGQLQAGLAAFGLGAGDLVQAFDRALASPLPQVVVSTQDLDALAAETDALGAAAFVSTAGAAAPGAVHPRPELPVPYTEPRNGDEIAIAKIWQEAFGIEQVGVHDNFFDLAGNSLLAIQIVTRISGALGVNLPMAAILESPTVAELAARAEASRPAVPVVPTAVQESEMDRLMREIESLSPEEAEARLARELDFATAAPAGAALEGNA
jgi:phthiocerol/phenolphthiocerol synthesis type-I polyketide synthase E